MKTEFDSSRIFTRKQQFSSEDLDVLCKELVVMIFLISAIFLASTASSLFIHFDLGYVDCTQVLRNKIVKIDSEGLRRGEGNIVLDKFFLHDCGEESLCFQRMENTRPRGNVDTNNLGADEEARSDLSYHHRICCSPNCFSNAEDSYGDCMIYNEKRGESILFEYENICIVRGLLVRCRGQGQVEANI